LRSSPYTPVTIRLKRQTSLLLFLSHIRAIREIRVEKERRLNTDCADSNTFLQHGYDGKAKYEVRDVLHGPA